MLILVVVLRSCCCITFYSGSLAQDCTSGFMDRDLLTERATKISLSQPTARSVNVLAAEQFLIIPGMNFSCSGNITSFKLGIEHRANLNNNINLEIYLYTPMTTASGRLFVQSSSRVIALENGRFSPNGVIEYDIRPNLTFNRGDVIGVYQQQFSRTRLYYSTQVSPPAGHNIIFDGFGNPVFTNFNGYLLLRPVITTSKS